MIAEKAIKAFEHGGNVYDAINPAAEFTQWLDFSANINPLGMPESVRECIKNNIDGLVHYPDPKGRELKKAIAEHYNVPENQIILGNGAVELLYVYMHTCQPTMVQIPVPSFSEYERAAVSIKAGIVHYKLTEDENFELDTYKLDPDLAGVETIIIGNPNNPTGNLLSRQKIQRLLNYAIKRNIDVVVDESFLDFRDDRDEYSVVDLVQNYQNLIVLKSLTKFYAVPGLRLGFAIVPEELCQEMERNKDPWNVNFLAQCAGVAALKDIEYQEKTRKYVAERAAELKEALKKIKGLKVFESTVNFIMINIEDTGLKSSELVAKMKRQGILVRDCSNYPGLDDYYIRVAVRSEEENAKLIEKLEVALGG